MRIDFQDVKARVPIELVAQVLLPDIKETDGEVLQYRASCPQCKAGGARAIAVTPGLGYFCNADRRGGDSIALVSHVKGVSMRQAAEWLVAEFNLNGAPLPPPQTALPQKENPPTPDPVAEEALEGLQPLKNLDPAHDAVKALKLPPEVATALGAGYCSKGLMKGYVAIALRLPSGKLIGYIGVKEGKLPTKWSLS